MKTPSKEPCPCQSTALYEKCCGRWHSGPHYLQAPNAALLMRSRYSAFVLDQTAYLLATWHPSTRPATLEPNPMGIKWLGLSLRRHEVQDATHETVEFVARSRLHGKASRLHETSRFVYENKQWFYLDGQY